MKTPKLTVLAAAGLGAMLLAGSLIAQPSEEAPPKGKDTTAGQVLEDPDQQTNAPVNPATTSPEKSGRKSEINRNELVVFGQNAELKAGERAQVVVVIGGSAKIDGKVDDAAVAILGNLEING